MIRRTRIFARCALFALLVLAALAPAACGGGSSSASPANASALDGSPISSPNHSDPNRGAGEFTNPVLNLDFPDPDVIKVEDTYYAYATCAGSIDIQAARSRDLVHWEYLGEALRAQPRWAKTQAGFTWAPDVSATADGKSFIMYFTARDAASDTQGIGVATSSRPDGPFQVTGAANDKPLICNPEEGGDIDPASFVDDDGSRYLLWSNNGTTIGKDTFISIQKTSIDGLTLEGQPTRLIRNDQAWEGADVEGPTLWKREGKYFLFYSANDYKTDRYAVGYAAADNILGPYTKGSKPILTTDTHSGASYGPGGQDIITGPHGNPWIVYHSWDPAMSKRWMQINELDWQGDVPVVKGPSRSPEPSP